MTTTTEDTSTTSATTEGGGFKLPSNLSYDTNPTVQGQKAAEYIIHAPPSSDLILSKEVLLMMGNVIAPPNNCSWQEKNKHTLWFLSFVTKIRRELLKALSRSLEVVRGEGFKLVNPNEVVPIAEGEFYNTVARAIEKFDFKAMYTNDALLTPQERQAKTDAMTRIAIIDQGVRAAENKARSEAKTRDDLKHATAPKVYSNVKMPEEDEG